MFRSVNEYEFADAFVKMDRESNFSYQGRKVLFEMLEEIEDSTGEEIELDVIAICCQFSEYTIEEIISDYTFIEEMVNDYKENLEEGEEEDKADIKEAVEKALDRSGAWYRWIDDESLILDVESI